MEPAVDTFVTLRDIGLKHVASKIGRKWDIIMEKGEGLWVTSTDGRKYLDFTSGTGTTNLGHCHPEVTMAAQEQCGKISHAQCAIYMNIPYLRLVQKLLKAMPCPHLDTFFFWNSGSEAIDVAIKVARRCTGRNNIIVFQGAYHGRTYGAASLTTSKTLMSEGVGPILPGVFTSPFPYWHQMGLPVTTPESELVRQALFQLELVLTQRSAPSDTAAIFLEPVLGEGGYVPTPALFIEGVAEVCKKHHILLVVDEVQTGFGRTGKLFAIEHAPKVQPDILVMGKGLSNGFPLSGISCSKKIMDTMAVGSLGGTTAGNAVACAAAAAVADVFASQDILSNVEIRSAQLFTGLRAIQSSPKTGKMIADVRGVGLMVAVEFNKPVAVKIQDLCGEKGLLLLTCSMFPTIRFIPALVVTEEEMSLALNIFTEACNEVAEEVGL